MRLTLHLSDEGCPQAGDGGQAQLERLVASWFATDPPSDSLVREHVTAVLRAFRAVRGMKAGNLNCRPYRPM